MIAAHEKSHALVLSGGGAYGAYEVGVMKALLSGKCSSTKFQSIRPESYAGTSIGAVNAAVMVANSALDGSAAVELLQKFWLYDLASGSGKCGNGAFRLRGSDPFEFTCLARQPAWVLSSVLNDAGAALRASLARGAEFATSSESLTRRTLALLDFSVLFDRSQFAQLLRRVAPLHAIRNSDQRLKVVATNFDSGVLKVFTNEHIGGLIGHDAIMASSAVPGIFSPVEIEGDLYTDGGTLMNAPLLPVVHGSDVLHIVYMDPDVRNIPVEAIKTTLGVLDRLLVTNFAYAMNRAIESIFNFNQSVRLIRSLTKASGDDPAQLQAFNSMAAGLKQRVGDGDYDPLVVHRYHPRDDLGGVIGFLDLSIEQVQRLIDRGYRDAIEHDCEVAGCLV